MTPPLHRALPIILALVAGTAHAQPHLRVGTRTVESGRTLTIYADYPSKEAVPLRWTIPVAPEAGAFTQVRHGRQNLFRAAPVAAPRMVTIRVTDPRGAYDEVTVQVMPPALAITCREVPGTARRFHLEATVGGRPEPCRWMVEEPDGGVFLQPRDGSGMDFLPPEASGARAFHIIACSKRTPDASLSGAYTVVTRNAGPLARLADGPRALVGSFLRPELHMTPFTNLTAVDTGLGWQAIVRVERFGPDFRNGGWLVAGWEGLGIVSPEKTFTPLPLPAGFRGSLRHMTVRPAAPGDVSQPEVVLAAGERDPATGTETFRLYRLSAGAGLEPMPVAGLPDPITALAMNRHGDLFVATPGTLYRAVPGGSLEPFAGVATSYHCGMEIKDGHGMKAGFYGISGLTLDPETGDLYAADAGSIRRITPAGDVTTILGTPAGVWSRDDTYEKILPGLPVPLGQACLASPGGLQFKDGVLFIVDRGRRAILAFNCVSRKLFQLVGCGHLGMPERGFGPLKAFNPDLLASESAYLRTGQGPLCLGDQSALYVDGSTVVQLHFPMHIFGSTAAGAARGPAAAAAAPAEALPAPAAPPAPERKD